MKNFIGMFLFYTNLVSENQLRLTEDEHQHCTKVLRKQVGDDIFITDGNGHIYSARISNITKAETVCNILNTDTKPTPHPNIIIAISPTKNASRLEWFVEKAVEIGISEIIVFNAQRTEKKSFNQSRIHKIMVSAMKQSLNVHLPTLNYYESTKLLLAKTKDIDQKFIAHCDGPTLSLNASMNKSKDAIVLIGPEGDFTHQEIEMALENGFKAVTLGDSRLRTETAGLVALMMAKGY